MISIALWAAGCIALVPNASSLAPRLERTPSADEVAHLGELRAEILEGYADFAHSIYSECSDHARNVRRAVRLLVDTPSEDSLRAARTSWLEARRVYGRTEVLRFYNGPIDNPRDGVETLLNAWPLDEAYIDRVEGATHGGIIGDTATYPNLNAALLTLLNERGGEANIAIGWHAIEFLLWGQDVDPDGPGARSHEDFVSAPGAERRCEYLRLCADLLVEHHDQVRDAWRPNADNFRARFLDPELAERSLRQVLAGMIVLSGFEMSGERLAVAYETRDQEEEHSCFSDNTHVDFLADQEGILAVYRGAESGGVGPGLRALARLSDPFLSEEVDKALSAGLERIDAMPVPFDQAILGADDGPGRTAVLAALLALEEQSDRLARLATVLGYEIAIQPGG